MKIDHKDTINRRSPEAIRIHYLAEKEIAARVRNSTREERRKLYASMYTELREKVPHHVRIQAAEQQTEIPPISPRKLKLVASNLNGSTSFVEFGPGDCGFALGVCRLVGAVRVIDISNNMLNIKQAPSNFQFVLYNGFELELNSQIADIVFSDQFLEHLHPDDIDHHLALVQQLLKPGGVYVFNTPHRFSGPHDISQSFSREAEGFHFKEWTFTELMTVLKHAGFKRVKFLWFGRGRLFPLPNSYFLLCERFLTNLPHSLRKSLCRRLLPSVTVRASI